MLNHMLLADRPFGEHIRFAFQFTVFIQDFQGTEQVIGRIVTESQCVGTAVDQSVFRGIVVIPLVQFLLQRMDCFFAVIVQLGIHQAMNAVPQGNHALDPFLSGRVQFRAYHDGVFPVIDLIVHDRVGEVFHVRISGNAFPDFFSVCQIRHFHSMIFACDASDCCRQLL